ncbi:unnamed protein product [Dracunculus medinensis]|uniref:Transposase n=1 Tax=Dracunculus medinensis TaxID=318479 RepID=A0A0N4UP33_DRAME|nr:unnamed protein product [Dracunculus medinensis]
MNINDISGTADEYWSQLKRLQPLKKSATSILKYTNKKCWVSEAIVQLSVNAKLSFLTRMLRGLDNRMLQIITTIAQRDRNYWSDMALEMEMVA